MKTSKTILDGLDKKLDDIYFTEIGSEGQYDRNLAIKELKKFLTQSITEMDIELLSEMTKESRNNNQVIGEKNDNYITLEQLHNFLYERKR